MFFSAPELLNGAKEQHPFKGKPGLGEAAEKITQSPEQSLIPGTEPSEKRDEQSLGTHSRTSIFLSTKG